MALVTALLPVILSATPASAAAGNLDTTFDTDGKLTTDIASANDAAVDVVAQADGKVVAVGIADTGPTDDFALTRYNANGALDTSFDTDGKVTTDFGADDGALGAVLQPDGKIVVAGYSVGPNPDLAVARYNANGSLDTTFDTDGKVTTDFAGGAEFGNDVSLQSDGKIVVAGEGTPTGGGATSLFLVARYNANGSLDTSFDTDGRVTTDVGPSGDFGQAVAIQADGRLAVSGYAGGMPGTGADFAVVRYNTNGSLDTALDTDGKVTTDFGTGFDQAGSIVVQPDGKLVAAGDATLATVDFALARYNVNGSLDTSFDTDGKVTTSVGVGSDFGGDVLLEADGDLVMVGDTDGATEGFSIVRYTPSGALDTTFDTDGKNVVDVTAGDDGALGAALQLDGKIVAAGFASNTTGDFGLVRFLGDPSVSINDVSVTEGNSGFTQATFTLTLTSASALPVNVSFATGDGTATSPADFLPKGTQVVTFAPGELTKPVVVDVVGDTLVEPDETFFVNLTNPTNVAVLDTQGLGTIKNDDTGTTAGSQTGYWTVASDGGIFAFGVPFFGSTGGLRLNKPIVGMAATPSGKGYWLVASDGGIFAFGDAAFRGSTGAIPLNKPIVGMASTPSGLGYWLVASDGGIFAFGDAVFRGSTGGIPLNKPIVGMSSTPSGNGYFLVATDGGIFAFGDAVFRGSTGAIRLAQPMVGMAATPSGNGYWLVASDGGIFAFGDAAFRGSTGAIRLNRPVQGMESTPTGAGYWLVATDGGIFAFGDALFKGSTGAIRLNQPMVGMAAP